MAEDWRTNVPFTTRMNSISRISNRLSATNATKTNAFGEAQKLEQSLLNEASSLEDYDIRLDLLLDKLSHTPTTSNLESAQIPSTDTTPHSESRKDASPEELPGSMSFGPYKNAVPFRQGLSSTIYKSRVPARLSQNFTGPSTPGAAVALKVTYLNAMIPPHDSIREARILRKAASDHVVLLWETFKEEGSSPGAFILVFPYMQHNLETLLRNNDITRSQGITILRDMFSGLAHIHSLYIIHRDIKPANILISSPSIRNSSTPGKMKAVLADFGIAWHALDPSSEPSSAKITDVGTTSYRAPELLFGLEDYDEAIDLWAAGCVAAEVLSRPHDSLFDSGELGSDLALINSIFQTLGTPNQERWPGLANLPDWGKVSFFDYPTKSWNEVLPNVTDEGRDLVASLVKYPCEQRLTAVKVLKHPLFNLEGAKSA